MFLRHHLNSSVISPQQGTLFPAWLPSCSQRVWTPFEASGQNSLRAFPPDGTQGNRWLLERCPTLSASRRVLGTEHRLRSSALKGQNHPRATGTRKRHRSPQTLVTQHLMRLKGKSLLRSRVRSPTLLCIRSHWALLSTGFKAPMVQLVHSYCEPRWCSRSRASACAGREA